MGSHAFPHGVHRSAGAAVSGPAAALFKKVVERAIVNCDDPAERRERVMIAREAGIFTDEEAGDWLALLDARAA